MKKIFLFILFFVSTSAFSQTRNLLMYVPKTGQAEMDIFANYLFGSISGGGFDGDISGYFLTGEFTYGLNSFVTLGLRQGIYTDYAFKFTSGSESLTKGTGDTALILKGFSNTEPAELYYEVEYIKALLSKKTSSSTTAKYEVNPVSERDSINLLIGGILDFKPISFGGSFKYKLYQNGSEDSTSSGISKVYNYNSGNGHSVTVFTQFNFDPVKIDLAAIEDVTYNYDYTTSQGASGNVSASTSRAVMLGGLFSINPQMEIQAALTKPIPKDDNGTTYSYYFLTAGMRYRF